jgi:cytoskeleton protein RodZ
MSSTPFGENLRREREMRGVSLEEISAATRIGTRFLQALEADQWDQLPGGVFNRGFIRAVARYLGLDEDSLVAEYALEAKNRDELRGVAEPVEGPRTEWLKWAVALAILAAIVVGAWFGYKQYGEKIAALLHKQTAASAATEPKPIAPPVVASADARSGSLAEAAGTLALKMEAGKPAEVKVVADGKILFEGHIEPGEVKQFESDDSLEISASEASALLLELNGRTIPPLGSPGQPGSIKLTQQDLRPAAGGSH